MCAHKPNTSVYAVCAILRAGGTQWPIAQVRGQSAHRGIFVGAQSPIGVGSPAKISTADVTSHPRAWSVANGTKQKAERQKAAACFCP